MMLPTDRLSAEGLQFLLKKAADDHVMLTDQGTNDEIDRILTVLCLGAPLTKELSDRAEAARVAMNDQLDAEGTNVQTLTLEQLAEIASN